MLPGFLGQDWDDVHFNRLWNHALMWLFIANWLGRLATMPPERYAQLHERFNTVWLEPVHTAAERHL